MKKDYEEIEKSDTSSNNQYKLKYTKEDSIGFRYSKYQESFITQEKRSFLKHEKQSWFSKFIKQTRLMTWKNYLVSSRNYKLTLFQIFTPIFICLLLVLLQIVLNIYNTLYVNKNPNIIPISNIRKCSIPSDCVTIGYALIVHIINLE
jgi:hypothetical protein